MEQKHLVGTGWLLRMKLSWDRPISHTQGTSLKLNEENCTHKHTRTCTNTHTEGLCTIRTRSWKGLELEVIVGTKNPCLQKRKVGKGDRNIPWNGHQGKIAFLWRKGNIRKCLVSEMQREIQLCLLKKGIVSKDGCQGGSGGSFLLQHLNFTWKIQWPNKLQFWNSHTHSSASLNFVPQVLAYAERFNNSFYIWAYAIL